MPTGGKWDWGQRDRKLQTHTLLVVGWFRYSWAGILQSLGCVDPLINTQGKDPISSGVQRLPLGLVPPVSPALSTELLLRTLRS